MKRKFFKPSTTTHTQTRSPNTLTAIPTSQVAAILENKEFIEMATCDHSGRPNVAPKFLLNTVRNCIYLADYVIGRTYRNLKINPQASLSTMDFNTLTGYQINGYVTLIDKGPVYRSLLKDFERGKIKFSAKRLIEGVRKEKKYKDFELEFPEKIVIYKIQAYEIVRIGIKGTVEKQAIYY
ncbi:MAG: pyridoxamine 5'-phosphate oxidase family protein [Candidatus Omnitrophica bacterium]|nr:pyridoxamine 5'-phosphate oxidase family protein [Candidatus Omnitrophota bacterium]